MARMVSSTPLSTGLYILAVYLNGHRRFWFLARFGTDLKIDKNIFRYQRLQIFIKNIVLLIGKLFKASKG